MDRLVARIMQDFSLDLYEPIYPRALDLGTPLLPRAGNLVSVVVGMRRSGKTYRLFQEMRRLLDDGVPPAQMLYFNFEDDRLKPLTSAVGDAVLDTFFELHPEAHERGAYLFLDEVQEIEDWGTWLRRIIDTKKVTVYATGSSSKLLSADVATAFRGRSVEYELLPMSFGEFVRCHEPEVFGRIPPREIVSIIPVFLDYIRQGRLRGVLADDGLWMDMGTPEAYIQAHLDFPSPAPRIHPGAEVSSGASVDAASVIGPRAIVEEGCRLRECVVWPGARVPAGTCAERRIFHLSL